MGEPVVGSQAEKAATAQKKAKPKQPKGNRQGRKKAGRPKGSRHRDNTPVVWTEERGLSDNMVQKQLCLVGHGLTSTHLLLEGKFGHNNAGQLAWLASDWQTAL